MFRWVYIVHSTARKHLLNLNTTPMNPMIYLSQTSLLQLFPLSKTLTPKKSPSRVTGRMKTDSHHSWKVNTPGFISSSVAGKIMWSFFPLWHQLQWIKKTLSSNLPFPKSFPVTQSSTPAHIPCEYTRKTGQENRQHRDIKISKSPERKHKIRNKAQTPKASSVTSILYFHNPKPRWQSASIKTQWTIARAMWLHSISVILWQQALNIWTLLKHKEMSLKRFYEYNMIFKEEINKSLNVREYTHKQWKEVNLLKVWNWK